MMITKINLLIKIIISITLIIYIFVFDYDYKIPLLFLILAYLIGSVILNPLLQSKILKFFVYSLDLIMLTYFSYATGNTYFSIFYYLLLIPERNLKQIFLLILISIPTVIYNYYQSNFYDFFYISMILGINLFLFKNVYFSKKLDEEVSKNIRISQEYFINLLRCMSKLDFYKKYYEVSTVINLFKKDKISSEFFCNFLYENLNADAILVFDYQQNECYKSGDNINCSKILNIINDEKLYSNENINTDLKYNYIISKKLNNVFLILFYKNYILDEEEIINLIRQ